MWIQLGQQAAKHCDFIAIDGEVGTHDAVLGRDRAVSNRLKACVTVVVLFKVGNSWHGGSVKERQTPTGAGFDSGLQTFLPTEGEIAERFAARSGIIAGFVIIFIHDLTVEMADRGGGSWDAKARR